MHRDIIEARRKIRAYKSALRRTLRRLQETCTHEIAYHVEGRSSEYFGRSPSVRMCCNCCYEEHSPWGSATMWPSGGLSDRFGNKATYSRKSLLGNSAIKVISKDRYLKIRP